MPSSRTTPVARPSRMLTRATAAPVRISAPASRAACAIARVSAPGPPLIVTLLPPGTGSIAALRRSTAPVPADHGPCAVPKIPRAAMAACSRSVSNHSATRSADRHRPPPQQPIAVLPSERAEAPPQLQQVPQLPGSRRAQRRRRAFQQPRRETRRGAPASSRTPDSARRPSARTRGSRRRCAPCRSRTPARARPATTRPAAGPGG